jgi:hypothetical protein
MWKGKHRKQSIRRVSDVRRVLESTSKRKYTEVGKFL